MEPIGFTRMDVMRAATATPAAFSSLGGTRMDISRAAHMASEPTFHHLSSADFPAANTITARAQAEPTRLQLAADIAERTPLTSADLPSLNDKSPIPTRTQLLADICERNER